ncbi:MAG TPA: hypothetical protein VMZ74_10235 [Ramlibacter sp.]|nr:hypothetical protein [Ramlibacter sp.]
MRELRGPIKHSGDVHMPDLDDGFDGLEALIEVSATPAPPPTAAVSSAQSIRPQARPSLMPLLGLLAGALVLIRLMR